MASSLSAAAFGLLLWWVFCSAGEMHCDFAVIYDAESRVAQIPSVSRIIVSQHKHLSVVLLQLKLSVKYTPPYQRKKKKKEIILLG